MADYGNTIFQSSSRNQYRIIRVKRILKRTVWALQQQIRQGEFEPGEFEVSFSMEDSLSAINIDLSEHEKMRLRGRIDRVDLCETDDKVYVKIIDYKTGNTSLDLVALYYGLQLQLAVYLDAAVELEQKSIQVSWWSLRGYFIIILMIRSSTKKKMRPMRRGADGC